MLALLLMLIICLILVLEIISLSPPTLGDVNCYTCEHLPDCPLRIGMGQDVSICSRYKRKNRKDG